MSDHPVMLLNYSIWCSGLENNRLVVYFRFCSTLLGMFDQ